MVTRAAEEIKQPTVNIILLLGAVLGLASGLTGIGGGVFLSPILLIFGWCSMRQSAAVAAGFILLNSVGGLAGYLVSDQAWPLGQAGWLLLQLLLGCLAGRRARVSSRLLHDTSKTAGAGAGNCLS